MMLRKKTGNKYLIAAAIVIVVLIVGIFVFNFNRNSNSSDSGNSADLEGLNPILPDSVSPEDNLILITAAGFEPNTFSIKQNETITFVNLDNKLHWPASNTHPTHEDYPGSGITNCGGIKEPYIFDACRGLKQNETYSFTFNTTGKWKFHDHLRPSETGEIFVSE